MALQLSPLARHLHDLIQRRTNHAVRHLLVEIVSESVILRGVAHSYYVKQMAQEVVLKIHPELRLVNSIEVDQVKESQSCVLAAT